MNVCIIALILAVVLFIVYEIALRYFFQFALGRIPDEKWSEPPNTGGYDEEMKANKEYLLTLPFETVHMTARDGVQLTGHFLRTPGADKTMIFCHGWRGRWYFDAAPFVKWYQSHGFHVLAIEERAHGNSDGKYCGMALLEHLDLKEWIDFYEKIYAEELGQLPIFLHGESMGAATVLMVTGREISKNVRGVIADCGFTCPYNMFIEAGKTLFHLPEYPILPSLNRRCRRLLHVDLKSYSTLEAMKKCEVPVLFIHGKKDTFIPYSMSEKGYAACHSKKKLLLVPEADHCLSIYVGREQYEQTMEEFVAEALE